MSFIPSPVDNSTSKNPTSGGYMFCLVLRLMFNSKALDMSRLTWFVCTWRFTSLHGLYTDALSQLTCSHGMELQENSSKCINYSIN